MVQDLGFDCSWEAGFAKIGHRMKVGCHMWDSHKKGAGMWDQVLSPPLPPPHPPSRPCTMLSIFLFIQSALSDKFMAGQEMLFNINRTLCEQVVLCLYIPCDD